MDIVNDSKGDGKSHKSKTKACVAVAAGAWVTAPFDYTGTSAVVALGATTLAACGLTYHGAKGAIRITKSTVRKFKDMRDEDVISSTSQELPRPSKDETNKSSRSSQNEEDSTSTKPTEAEIQAFKKDFEKSHGKLATAVAGIVLQSMMSVAIPSAGVGLVFNLVSFKRSLKKIKQLKQDAGNRGINLRELKTDKTTAMILGVLIKVSLTAFTLGHSDLISIVGGIDDIVGGIADIDPTHLPGIQVDHILGRWFESAPVDTITDIAGMPQDEVLKHLDLQSVPTWQQAIMNDISTQDLIKIGVASEVNLVEQVVADPLLKSGLSAKRKMSAKESL